MPVKDDDGLEVSLDWDWSSENGELVLNANDVYTMPIAGSVTVDSAAGWNDTDFVKTDEMNEIKMQMAEFNQRLKAIEDQILIVRRDNALEEHFEELKEAWKAYNELADKLRTFRALQDSQ